HSMRRIRTPKMMSTQPYPIPRRPEADERPRDEVPEGSDDRPKDPPPVRVHVLESETDGGEPVRLLGPEVEPEREFVPGDRECDPDVRRVLALGGGGDGAAERSRALLPGEHRGREEVLVLERDPGEW